MAGFLEISPPKRLKGHDKEEVELLTLAPFQPIPKIIFHNVKVNSRACRKLTIRNPTNESLTVKLAQLPPDDRCFQFNFTSVNLPACEEAVLEIIWIPCEAGNWLECIPIRTSSKVKFDVKIICNSISAQSSKIVKKRVISKNSPKVTYLAKKPFKPQIRKPSPRLPLPQSAASSPCRRQTFLINADNKENAPLPKPSNQGTDKVKHNISKRFEDLVLSPLDPNMKLKNERFTTFDDLEMSPVVLPSKVKKSFQADFVDGDASSLCKDLNEILPIHGESGNVSSSELRRATFAVAHQKKNDFSTSPKELLCKPLLNVPKVIVSEEDGPDDLYDSLEGDNIAVCISPDAKSTLDTVFMDSTIKFNLPSPSEDPRRCSTGIKNFPGTLGLTKEDSPVCKDLFREVVSPPAHTLKAIEAFSRNSSHPSDHLSIGTYDCVETGSNDRLSSETYVKHRWSSETFVKGDHSRGSPCPNERSSDIDVFLTDESLQSSLGSPRLEDHHFKSPLLSIAEEDTKENANGGYKKENTAFVVTFSSKEAKTKVSSTNSKLKVLKPKKKVDQEDARRKLPVPPSLRLSSMDQVFKPGESLKANVSGAPLSKVKSVRAKSLGSGLSTSKPALSGRLPEARLSLSKSNLNLKQPALNSSILRGSKRLAQLQSANSEIFYNPDEILAEVTNVDPFAASTTVDPFLNCSVYNDDAWLDRQERDIIKWLNALLTPPSELDTNTDLPVVDVGDLWQKTCRQSEVSFAPSREEVSSDHYNKQNRLTSLRKAALALYRSKHVASVLQKISVNIEKRLLSVRDDRDLHLDVGLQQFVLELLLCYNPLWLRIGLEAVYGRTVLLKSNSDYLGLVTFILNNLITDAHIVSTFSHPTVPHLKLPGFQVEIKKFILKKFLFIVYFLDHAKTSKLIGHDPCLFMRSAKHKESRSIVAAFSRELLAGIGDVNRLLAALGCKLSVKQSYLDEFPYGVQSLLDLRDGVHLVRVMELILNSGGLLAQLRVPAISRLQKVHNVEVALTALSSAGYTICGDIQARHIVEGHREKTLSLLWQIIYKFQAPRFTAAALVIQRWWRHGGLSRELERRVRARKRARREAAVVTLQSAWRAILAWRRVSALRVERLRAAVVLQKHWRRHAAEQQLLRARRAATVIGRWYRGAVLTRRLREAFLLERARREAAAVKLQALWRGLLTRKRFTELRQMSAALRIQMWFRRRRRRRLLLAAAAAALEWQRQQAACRRIQTAFRAWRAMKCERARYLALRAACIALQSRFRARQAMQLERGRFLALRGAALAVQQRLRSRRAMRTQRAHFLEVRHSACILQVRFRALRQMRSDRGRYLELHAAAVTIQRKFRARRVMKRDRSRYLAIQKSVRTIQLRWRAELTMRSQRAQYIAVGRAVSVLQLRFRAHLLMKNERAKYLHLRAIVVFVQQKFRATSRMHKDRDWYLKVQKATLTIQRHWRAQLAMKRQQVNFKAFVKAARTLQCWYRARLLQRTELHKYQQLRSASIIIQRWFRASQMMKKERNRYLQLQEATITIQNYWRAQLSMRYERTNFVSMSKAACILQRWYRSLVQMRKDQSNYQQLRLAAVNIQRRFRAMKQTQMDLARYIKLREATIIIQRRWRAQVAMRIQFANFTSLRKAACVIQRNYRALIQMRSERMKYIQVRSAAMVIQQRYKAKKLMLEHQFRYRLLQKATITIQRNWREQKALKLQEKQLLVMEKAAVTLQRLWRAKRATQQHMQRRLATITIQRWWRAIVLARKERKEYEQMRASTRIIQIHWRAHHAMLRQRAEFQSLQSAAVVFQKFTRRLLARRKYLKMKEEALALRTKQDNAAKLIQITWRRWLKEKHTLECQKNAAIRIQALWRGYKSRKCYQEERCKVTQRAMELNSNAPEPQCMKERIENLCFDLDKESVGGVIYVLNALSNISIISPTLCEEMVLNGIVPKLFNRLCPLNRGVADASVASVATKILLNLTKYDKTISAVWEDGTYLNLYPHLMKKWHSIQEDILINFVTILWHFSHNSQWSQILGADERLRSTIVSLISKYKAKKHKVQAGSALLPALDPNWGSLQKRVRPNVFLDPLFGLRALCHRLNININM